MTKSYRVLSDLDYPYFVTCTIVDWLPVLASDPYRQIVLDSLDFTRTQKHIQLNAFVIMPSHLHAIMWPEEGVNLSNVMRDFKRFTSKAISKEAINRKAEDYLAVFAKVRKQNRAQDISQFQVWKEGFHPEAIYTADFARQKIDYIHENPRRAGLVAVPEEWPNSSIRAYFYEEETYPPTDIIAL